MGKSDRLVKEWDKAVEGWVDFVRGGKDYTRFGLNNPATFELIGDVEGLVVLDLACGEGCNTRILARQGAKVTGIDFSGKMLKVAKQKEAEETLGITYRLLDAADLNTLPSNHFDLVTCFMALQDIEDYEQAVSEVARILKVSGRFVFSIPHPCFEAIIVNGRKVRAAQRYFEITEYPIEWKMERLQIQFKTTSYHRTLTHYFNVLHLNKLVVSRLVEPRLSQQASLEYPYLREALVRPQSVIVEATRIASQA